jgi:hypothetical protein
LRISEYAHDEGCSIAGGFVYRGSQSPSLAGVYLYSDACSGTIWGLKRQGSQVLRQLLLQTNLPITTFGEDELGELFFADYGSGTIHQIFATEGSSGQQCSYALDIGGVAIPNSICFSLDGRVMYFCDSLEKRIRQCDYDAGSGAVSNIREFVRFAPDDGLPDGSIIDAEGCLWNAAWGVGRVRRYAPDGRVLAQIAVPAKNTTCLAFGGDSLADLYITSSRQEMTEDELASTPDAGGVYHAAVGPVGVCDAAFRDR